MVNDEKKLGFETEEEAAYLSLQLVIGAADTVGKHKASTTTAPFANACSQSRVSTWSFLEAMMMFPSVQEKAYHAIGMYLEMERSRTR